MTCRRVTFTKGRSLSSSVTDKKISQMGAAAPKGGWTHLWHFFFSKSLQSVSCHLLGYSYNHMWVRMPTSWKSSRIVHLPLTYGSHRPNCLRYPTHGGKRRGSHGIEGKYPDLSWADHKPGGSSSTLSNWRRCRFSVMTEHWSYSPRETTISTAHSPGSFVFAQLQPCLTVELPWAIFRRSTHIMVVKLITCLI